MNEFDGFVSYLPKRNWILIHGAVEPGLAKVRVIRLLRDEHLCSGDHSLIHDPERAPVTWLRCHACKAVV